MPPGRAEAIGQIAAGDARGDDGIGLVRLDIDEAGVGLRRGAEGRDMSGPGRARRGIEPLILRDIGD